VPPIDPRLLDVHAAARYLGVSAWTIRDLLAAGELARVTIPGPGGRDLRRVLVDRVDVDRLVERWKERPS
jgi:excisionase family DNA binding protein